MRLTLRTGDAPPVTGRVETTHHGRPATSALLAASLTPRARWNPGGATWTVLDTTLSLQFGDGGRAPLRTRLPAGRYVVTVQQVTAGSAHFVFTPARDVDEAGLSAPPGEADLAHLDRMDGVFIPAEVGEAVDSVAAPRVVLTGDVDAPDEGALTLQLGSYAWSAGFTATPPAGRQATGLERFGVPPTVRAVLLRAGPMTLFTLDPDGDLPAGEGFHGYRVLGEEALDLRQPNDAAAARELRTLLRLSILAHPSTAGADCFRPRHGLRFATAGGPLDLVICFECEGVRVVGAPGAPLENLLVTGFWEPGFSAVFRRYGLKIAK